MMKKICMIALCLQISFLAPGFTATEAEPFFSNESVPVVAVENTSETLPKVTADAGAEKLPESQIPVNISEKKAMASADSGLNRVLISLGILLLAGFGVFFYLKRYVKPTAAKQQQIKVLTQHHLGPKKSLVIVRVAGESMLIGVTDQNISMIKSLALLDEEIPEFSEKDFSSALEKSNQRSHATRKDMDLDDFSMKGIRDIVTKKLSNMRTLE
ncbi:MAG: flagellar biosynthetic protein FliO [Pseudobdellovibrionaceae bacterium]